MNSNEFRDKYAEKIDQMIEFCKNDKIDTARLSETNGKFTTRTTEKNKLKNERTRKRKMVLLWV